MRSSPSSSHSSAGTSSISRADIRASIRFHGVIRGCRDHQWLIADALWEVSAGPTESVPERWVIASHDPSHDPFSASTGVFSGHDTPASASPASPRLIARDRVTGWTTSAASASELAAKIRRAFGDGGFTNRGRSSAGPTPPPSTSPPTGPFGSAA